MFKKIPRISVIVPIYNVASFLPKCIESILHQSFVDFELILINDGSHDNSHDICLSYQEKDKRITIINKPNGGLLSARKAGLENARAEFISFVDGDDWVDTDFLTSMYRIVELHNVDLVISGFIRAFEGRNERIKPLANQGIIKGSKLIELTNSMMNNGVFFQHGVSTFVWNKLFRREVLVRNLFDVPNEITMGEDAAITYSYIPLCKSIGITHTCSYFYRQRVNSIVKSFQNPDIERKHLTNLFSFLNGTLQKYIQKSVLSDQVLYYLFSQALIRFGGFISENFEDIPFEGLNKGDRVILYSSGTFGQRLLSCNNKYSVVNIISWIDLDHQESKSHKLVVDSPYTKVNNIYDSIIIASIDESKFNEISSMLDLYGFNSSKYRHLKLERSFVVKYLGNLGFNLDFLETN